MINVRTSMLCIVATSILIVACGTVSEIDPIALWILSFVDGLPEFAWLKPYRLPPPANMEYGFRPISILLLKLYTFFWGVGNPPLWILASKAFFSAWLLGMASWRWLRMQGMQAAALPVSCLTMILSPHLFGLWCLVEFDGVGAAAVLGVSILLEKPQKEWLENFSLGVLIAFAALLKESTAVIMFAVMLAELWMAYRSGRDWKTRLYWLVIPAGIWLLWASPMILGVRSNVGTFPVSLRLPLVFFTAWQLVFVVGLAGVAVLMATQWESKEWVAWLCVGVLVVVPDMTWINHYEAMYFSPLWLGSVGCVVLYGMLFWLGIAKSTRKKHKEVIWRVLFGMGAMLLALLVSSSPREDLATRIFLPIIPMLLGLIFERGWKLRHKKSVQLLMFGFVSFAFINAMNTCIERHGKGGIQKQGLEEISEQELQDSVVLFSNFSFRLSKETLQASGEQSHDIPIVFVPDMFTGDFPVIMWGERFDIQKRVDWGQKTFVFWSGLRCQEPSCSAEEADFSYTRRPLGAFSSLHAEEGDRLPEHNYLEDMHKKVFGGMRTPLQQKLAVVASRDFAVRNQFVLVSSNIFSWPQRILLGRDIVHTYSYDVELWSWGTE